MKTIRNHAFTLIELLVVITIIATLAGLAVPAYNLVQTIANQTKGVNNAKQIVLAMKLFSKEHNSQYPDSVVNPQTGSLAENSNEAFRNMIQDKIVKDERIFGCPAGYNPDASIGLSPSYSQALLPGENHWAMTANLTDTSAGNMPVVFENPATLSWPPLWNADAAGQVSPGRTWPGGKIIIARNDGSVTVETLAGDKGKVGPRVMAGGMNLFTQASEGIPQRILTVAYGKGRSPTGPGTPDPIATPSPLPSPAPDGAPPPGSVPSAAPALAGAAEAPGGPPAGL